MPQWSSEPGNDNAQPAAEVESAAWTNIWCVVDASRWLGDKPHDWYPSGGFDTLAYDLSATATRLCNASGSRAR
jgi:hypothetical protein